MRSTIILLFAASTLAGCGVHVGSRQDDQNTSYSYHFNDNGCDTGKHAFTDKNSYCRALSDEQLNNGCAESERQQVSTRDCGA